MLDKKPVDKNSDGYKAGVILVYVLTGCVGLIAIAGTVKLVGGWFGIG